MQREIARKLLISLVIEIWLDKCGFFEGWDFFYSLDHHIFQKVKNNLSKNC